MVRGALVSAALTGVFCAGFAVVVDTVTMLFSIWQLMAVSFVSGALGSLFARLIMVRFGMDEKGDNG